jgi:hypothetical protein
MLEYLVSSAQRWSQSLLLREDDSERAQLLVRYGRLYYDHAGEDAGAYYSFEVESLLDVRGVARCESFILILTGTGPYLYSEPCHVSRCQLSSLASFP